MPDLAGRQRRLLGDLEAGQSRHRPDRSDAVQVRGGEHPAPNGFGDVDAANSGVGERAADEGHILHAGQPNIADILPQAPHQALVLLAGQPRADALRGFGAVSVSQCETSSIRRCAARTSWPFGRRNSFENAEMIGACDRQQRARRMSRRAQRMELTRIVNKRGKLTRSIGDGERLQRSRRRPHRRQGRDLRVGELQHVVERGVAQRPQIVDAGNGETRRDQPMAEMQHSQLGAGRPAGEHHGARDAMRRSMMGEPVERGADLSHNRRQARLRRERIARHRDRPAGERQSFGISGEKLAGIPQPIAAVDEDKARRACGRRAG